MNNYRLSDKKKYDRKFLSRFSEEERSKMSFQNPVLIAWTSEGEEEEIELSINYMKCLLNTNNKLDYMLLYCDAIYEGIRKRILIKENPSRNDLKNWYLVAKEAVRNI